MGIYKKRNMTVPFSDDEWESFDKAMFHYGFKKQAYVRNLVITDLQKKGWIPQNQVEKTAETVPQEV